MPELFRREALEALSTPAMGGVVLLQALPISLMVAFATLVSVVMAVTICRFTYTKHENIPGVVTTREESIQITSPTSGLLLQANVSEGAAVRKGETLFVFTSDRKTLLGTNSAADVAATIRSKITSLNEDLDRAQMLSRDQLEAARKSVSGLGEQLKVLQSEDQALQLRRHSGQKQVDIHESLVRDGFESELVAQQKRDELSEIGIRISENKRQISVVESEIQEKYGAMNEIRLREPALEGQTRRQILDSQSELIAQNTSETWTVVSAIDGVATNINIHAGQAAPAGTMLAEVLPVDTNLQVKVFASSREIGFTKVGQRVQLRVDAFPYMKFGTVEGVVDMISPTPVRLSELTNSSGKLAIDPGSGNVPLYPILIRLNGQFLSDKGAKLELRTGMQVEAQVQLETRTLLEWLIEPLQSTRH